MLNPPELAFLALLRSGLDLKPLPDTTLSCTGPDVTPSTNDKETTDDEIQ